MSILWPSIILDRDQQRGNLHGHFLAKFYPEEVVSANDKNFAELPFEIWPNPTTDLIRIQYQNASELMTVSIIDLQVEW